MKTYPSVVSEKGGFSCVMVFTSTVCTGEVAEESRLSRRYVLSNHYTIIRETTNSVCKGKDALTRNNMRNANTSIFMPLPPITMSLHLLLNLPLDRLNIIIWLDFLPICSDYSISNIRLLHCFFGVPVYVANSFLQERLVEFRDFALDVFCEGDAGVYGDFASWKQINIRVHILIQFAILEAQKLE